MAPKKAVNPLCANPQAELDKMMYEDNAAGTMMLNHDKPSILGLVSDRPILASVFESGYLRPASQEMDGSQNEWGWSKAKLGTDQMLHEDVEQKNRCLFDVLDVFKHRGLTDQTTNCSSQNHV